MSYFRNKPLLITAIVIVIAVILAVVSHFGDGLPKKIASAVTVPVQKAAAVVVRPVSKFIDNIADAPVIREENERLKAEITELEIQNRSVEEYIKENDRLRNLLAIRDGMKDKEVLSASVVSADSSGYGKNIVINRGEMDGVSEGDAVVSENGVIGRVSETGAHWARVTTILSPGHSLGVRISRTSDIAVAEGDISLVRENLLKLDYLPQETQLIEGDIIVTSGVGGIYPPDLIVGKVKKIRKDNSGKTDYAVIEPIQNHNRLYEVIVITDWTRENEVPMYIGGETEEDVQVSEGYETHTDIGSNDILNAQG